MLNSAPQEVYEALMDSKKHKEFTGSEAKIGDRVGDESNGWDGHVFGKNLELLPGKKIVQEWTTTEWPKGYPTSRLEITLTKKDGGTELKMFHSKVPVEQREEYAEGWKSYYWEPLKAYFE
jgi:uncharacterized protein YndB with AHSA1/START domain